MHHGGAVLHCAASAVLVGSEEGFKVLVDTGVSILAEGTAQLEVILGLPESIFLIAGPG